MARPYVIRIFVTSGNPDGVRVVDKSNWNGRGVVFGRADLPRASPQGLDAPGVYVLLGDDPDETFDRQIYVGQGENVARRLSTHQDDDTKEFWADTVAFVSPAGFLNRAHILHLESRLIVLAHQVGRSAITNRNRPTAPTMTPADEAEAEGFLTEMLGIFPVLGISSFDVPIATTPGERRFYLDGRGAKGEGVERSDGFLVFAGGTARIKETPSLKVGGQRLRKRLLDSGKLRVDGDAYRLTEDVLFSSPSNAAMVLQAASANGRTAWCDEHGTTLKHHQTQASKTGV